MEQRGWATRSHEINFTAPDRSASIDVGLNRGCTLFPGLAVPHVYIADPLLSTCEYVSHVSPGPKLLVPGQACIEDYDCDASQNHHCHLSERCAPGRPAGAPCNSGNGAWCACAHLWAWPRGGICTPIHFDQSHTPPGCAPGLGCKLLSSPQMECFVVDCSLQPDGGESCTQDRALSIPCAFANATSACPVGFAVQHGNRRPQHRDRGLCALGDDGGGGLFVLRRPPTVWRWAHVPDGDRCLCSGRGTGAALPHCTQPVRRHAGPGVYFADGGAL